MTTLPMTTRVPISTVQKLLTRALVARHISPNDAKIITEEFIVGELQEKLTHGLFAFPGFVKQLDATKRKKSRLLKQTHSMILVEGGGNPGVAIGLRYADAGIKLAKKEGVALVAIRNMLTWLRPGTIAEHVARKGLLAYVVNSSGAALVTAPEGAEPLIGTNATGLGIPTAGEPIVADMALSERAYGEVRLAKRHGTELPSRAFVDKNGRFTDNPDCVFAAAHFGGYKGFAFGLWSEVLTGSLLGLPIGPQDRSGDYVDEPRGGFILIIDPSRFTTLQTFKKVNHNFSALIKRSRRAIGAGKLFLPGERARDHQSKNRRRGSFLLDKELLEKLDTLAGKTR